MAKRNASGPSSGRRGSSRGNSGRKSFSDKRKSSDDSSDERRTGRSSSFGGDKKKSPYKKRDGDTDNRRGGARPFKKSGSFSDKRSSRSDSGSKPFSERRRSSDDKFEARGPGRSSSYSGDRRKSSYGKRDEEGSERRGGARPFKKPGRFSDKRDERPTDYKGKRNFAEGRPRKEGKPFKSREGSSDDKGRRKTGGKDFKKDKDFKKGPSYGLPFKRSYDKKKSDAGSAEESHGFFKKTNSRYSEKGPSKRAAADDGAPAQTDKIRLNRYIANSGVCSRREADELIKMGLVSVNGKTITEMGFKVNPGDEVRYENKVLKAEKPVYILLNKPKGYLTTTDDPQERNTVMHIIGGAVKARIYPVGRLDRNTTGLLLLTNDGDLADKLMHPSYNVKKIYKVELDRPLTKADFQTILDGVSLEEGRATVDDLAIVSEDGKTVGVEIHIGWNRVIRRIFESLQYEVVRLDRSVYAGLDKKDVGRGEWRFLTKEEIIRLKHLS
jgi:23S rRNA pseudouridine2605 synthase